MVTKADRDTDVMSEVHVMLEVAQALERLEDPAARQRVLHWLTERYQKEIVAAPPTVGAASQRTAADPSLTVDGLTEFFPVVAEADDDLLQPAPPAPAGVENMIRGFADDFRRFALEWQGA